MMFLALSYHDDLTPAQQEVLNDILSLDKSFVIRKDAAGQKLLRNLAALGFGEVSDLKGSKGVRFTITAKRQVVRNAGPFSYARFIPNIPA